jgi:NDP-sugar pyrophosphorylase family protein
MKCLILAAGFGSRLGEITKNTPKPMLRYLEKPILEHNILCCKKSGITEIFINLHHMGNIIQEYFGDGSRWGVNIKYSYEKEILGTAGAFKKISSNVKERGFLIIYGDNLIDYDLKKIYEIHMSQNNILTITLANLRDAKNSGIVTLSSDSTVSSFIEKPHIITSENHLANMGVYYLDKKILDYIDSGYSDFANNVFPRLIDNNIKIFGHVEDKNVLAFDTIALYNKNIVN